MIVTRTDADVTRLYRATRTPTIVEVPSLTFLTLDGRGDPNTGADYPAAVQALYTLSYGVKFAIKRALGLQVKVSPLEGFWWAEDMDAFRVDDRSAWQWTAAIRQPVELTRELLDDVAAEVARSKNVPAAEAVRLAELTEGLCAQVLHVGPYSAEAPTIARLHGFIAEHGYALTGKHHEIYLGDPRRAAPEKLRTIIRQPVAAPE
jgi:hypothetical protein